MKILYISPFIFLTCLLSFFACKSNEKIIEKDQGINTLTNNERNKDWELLFDGESLEGWKSYNGGSVSGWKVVEGVLHNSGEGSDHGGDIITEEKFDNFELNFEWKATSESNSGIFYYVQEYVGDAIYKSGLEYQLADDEGRAASSRNNDQTTGALYGMEAPQNAEVRPLGKWNSSKIVVNGAHVEHWLNGKKVVETELWTDDWYANKKTSKWKDESYYGEAKKGYIGLQDHGGLTMFRNIKLREL